MTTTPFLPFAADRSPTQVEAAGLGFGAGALLGALIPAFAILGEVAGGATVQQVLAHPSAATFATLAVPAVSAVLGALIAERLVRLDRSARTFATKAASLMDEVWELRGELESRAASEAAVSELPPLPRGADRPLPIDRGAPVGVVHAQARVIGSFGTATRDTLRRMRINLRSLRLAGLSPIQQRLVEALTGHVEALEDLAHDVLTYADDHPPTAIPGAHRPATPVRPDVRGRGPRRRRVA